MTPISKVLVVEDEAKLAELLKDYLEQGGFSVIVLERGDRVIPQVRQSEPDLILLDLMLPGMDGVSVCRELRKFSTVPIIMITAKVDEVDRLLGLELGADDYVCKPFSPREVVARVRAVLRRTHPEPAGKKIEFGPIVLDERSRAVTVHGRELTLTPSEFRLLSTLMADPKRVFTRNELINCVRGYAFEGYDRTMDSHVKNLRKKLAEHLPGRELIRTVYAVGYSFQPPIDR